MPMLMRVLPVRRVIFGTLCALLAAAATTSADASFHTFQVNELYSNADGTVQYIELREAFSANDQEFFSGHTLSVTRGATTHTFTFLTDLPNGNTASARVLIATPGFAQLGIVAPDYIVPTGFLLVGGGTVDYARVDSLTYPPLPTDGVQSLNRDGTTGINSPTNFAGQTGSISAPPPPPAAGNGIPTLDRWGLATLVAALMGAAWLARRRDAMRQ